MTNFIGIDPGPTHSGFVKYEGDFIQAFKADNATIRRRLASEGLADEPAILVVEFTKPYTLTMKGGRSYMPLEVVQAAFESGRMVESFRSFDGEPLPHVLITRQEVKKALLGKTTGGDSEIRQAVIDRFGGKETAIGKKKTPGPLYGVTKDCWAAIAIVEAYRELDALPNEKFSLTP